jgi:hypothetical protein
MRLKVQVIIESDSGPSSSSPTRGLLRWTALAHRDPSSMRRGDHLPRARAATAISESI